MKQEFAVTASSFALYEAFKKDAEDIGYVYEYKFSRFDKEQLKTTNCLYFSSDFQPGDKFNAMALTNYSDENNMFDLDCEYSDALNFARLNFSEDKLVKAKQLTEFTMDEVFEILAEHAGVDKSDIIIVNKKD